MALITGKLASLTLNSFLGKGAQTEKPADRVAQQTFKASLKLEF